MNFKFFEFETLAKELETLPHFHKVAFAASCCERMLPTHNLFSEVYDWGDPTIPLATLDQVWLILQGKPIDPLVIEKFFDDCGHENVFPDDLDYGGIECYCAQETLSAICETLKAILKNNLESIITVAEYTRNIVEMQIKDKDYDKEYVASHLLALQEIAKETEDLQRLKQTPTLDPDFLQLLRTSFVREGKNLISLREN